MKKTSIKLGALILVMVMITLAALPGIVSADSGDANNTDSNYYWYNLSTEEIGAGATPLTGEISVAEYHARQVIMWSSPVSLDINLKPVGQGPFLVSVPNK